MDDKTQGEEANRNYIINRTTTRKSNGTLRELSSETRWVGADNNVPDD